MKRTQEETPACNINELIRNLDTEDAAIFSALSAAGYDLFLEDHKYVWRNNQIEPHEAYDPIDNDEEAIRAARTIYNDSVKPKLAKPTQSAVVEKLLSKEPVEHFKAHEIDQRARLCDWLRAEESGYTLDEETARGTVDLYTDEAVYDFKCGLTVKQLLKTSERLVNARSDLISAEKIDRHADAIIIVCCAPELGKLKDLADEVAVMEIEEIFNPSPPGFVAKILDAIAAIESSEEFTKFVEVNSLQNPEGDKRFTPSHQQKLLDALNEKFGSLGEISDVEETEAVRSETLFPAAEMQAANLTPQMHPSKLTRHPSLLMRAIGLDDEHLAGIEEAYRAGRSLPPLDIFFDGEVHWVADGNHRHEGATRAHALCHITLHKGTLDDAILFALGANADHGKNLTNDDKNLKAVIMLSRPELFKKSDSQLEILARHSLTQPFIGKVRRGLASLKALLEEDEHKLKDEDIADTFSVSVGLVRAVRRLTDEQKERLTQNILEDTGRRVGKDNVSRSVLAKSEPEAPLLAQIEPEQAVESESAEPATEEAQTGASAPTAAEVVHALHTNDEEKKVLAESQEHTAVDQPAAKLTPAERERNFKSLLPLELARAGWELEINGDDFRCTNMALSLQTYWVRKTATAFDDARKLQKKHDSQPTIEKLLRGRKMAVGLSWMPAVKGKVQLSVTVDGDIQGAARPLLDAVLVETLPEPILRVIREQLKAKNGRLFT